MIKNFPIVIRRALNGYVVRPDPQRLTLDFAQLDESDLLVFEFVDELAAFVIQHFENPKLVNGEAFDAGARALAQEQKK